MKVLGIETATVVCSAAVAVEGAVRAEEEIVQRNAHAENIMRLIRAVLDRAAVTPGQLDAIAVSIGPGSFTGLRIGLSVAKGLCFALEKPLVTVPTLEALAHRALESGVIATPFILAALDARRDEVYCQLFDARAGVLVPVGEARDLTLDGLARSLDGRAVTITGDAAAKLRAHDAFARFTPVPERYASCSASSVAVLGEAAAAAGRFADVKSIEPVYIKEFYTTNH